MQTCFLVVSRGSTVSIAIGYGMDDQQGHEADHLYPTSAKIKKPRIYTSTTPYVIMV
jgi:hypothetical protein